jgi:hypothetical protein
VAGSGFPSLGALIPAFLCDTADANQRPTVVLV